MDLYFLKSSYKLFLEHCSKIWTRSSQRRNASKPMKRYSALLEIRKKMQFRFLSPRYWQKQKILIVFSFLEGVGKQMLLLLVWTCIDLDFQFDNIFQKLWKVYILGLSKFFLEIYPKEVNFFKNLSPKIQIQGHSSFITFFVTVNN